jgi:hypothetical protein
MEAEAELHQEKPESFTLAVLAAACWDEAVFIYDCQMLAVATGNLPAPNPGVMKRARTLAATAKLLDMIGMDSPGFVEALKRVKLGGKFK